MTVRLATHRPISSPLTLTACLKVSMGLGVSRWAKEPAVRSYDASSIEWDDDDDGTSTAAASGAGRGRGGSRSNSKEWSDRATSAVGLAAAGNTVGM